MVPAWVPRELRAEATPSGLVINEHFQSTPRLPGDIRGLNSVYGHDTGPLPPGSPPLVESSRTPVRGWNSLYGFDFGPPPPIHINHPARSSHVHGFDSGPLPPNLSQRPPTYAIPLVDNSTGYNGSPPPCAMSQPILREHSRTASCHMWGCRLNGRDKDRTVTPSDISDSLTSSEPIPTVAEAVGHKGDDQSIANTQSEGLHRATVEDAEETEYYPSTAAETEIGILQERTTQIHPLNHSR